MGTTKGEKKKYDRRVKKKYQIDVVCIDMRRRDDPTARAQRDMTLRFVHIYLDVAAVEFGDEFVGVDRNLLRRGTAS